MNPDDPTLAGRYLADQLTEQERADFESALHKDPGVIAEVEATARLKVGLERLRASGELEALIGQSPIQRWTSLLPLAAAVAALVVGALLWRSSHGPEGTPDASSWLAGARAALTDSAGQPLKISATVAVFRKRSAPADAILAVPQSPGLLELRVLPMNPDASGRYRLELSGLSADSSVKLLGALTDLQPDAEGFVTAYANASHLPPGRYKLTLTEPGTGGQPATSEAFQIELTGGTKN